MGHLKRLSELWNEIPIAQTVNDRTARFTGMANLLTPTSPHYLTSKKGRRVWFAWLWGWLIGISDANRHLVPEEREACAMVCDELASVGDGVIKAALVVAAAAIRARGE